MADIIGFPHGANQNSYPCDVEPPCEGQGLEAVAANLPSPATQEINLSYASELMCQASLLIDGERDVQHGNRLECHTQIARLWTAYLGVQITPHEVAIMMTLLKIARTKTGAFNVDCYVDGCGYLSIAGELAKGASNGTQGNSR